MVRSHRIVLTLCAAAAVMASACDGNPFYPSSTQAGPGVSPSRARVGIPVTWTFLGAAPTGDCFADRLNLEPATAGPENRIVITRSDSSLRVQFNPDLEDDVGYLPGFYSGSVLPDGSFQLMHEPWVGPFLDPYRIGLHPMCYSRYILVGGALTGAYEPDGVALAGTIEDTFQVLDEGFQPIAGLTFSVKSSFRTR
jgi:hypothetical protein